MRKRHDNPDKDHGVVEAGGKRRPLAGCSSRGWTQWKIGEQCVSSCFSPLEEGQQKRFGEDGGRSWLGRRCCCSPPQESRRIDEGGRGVWDGGGRTCGHMQLQVAAVREIGYDRPQLEWAQFLYNLKLSNTCIPLQYGFNQTTSQNPRNNHILHGHSQSNITVSGPSIWTSQTSSSDAARSRLCLV